MVYKTSAGDMWDAIAFKELGSEKYVEELMNANRKHLGTFIFNAGVELTLPEIEKKSATINLPPWRR